MPLTTQRAARQAVGRALDDLSAYGVSGSSGTTIFSTLLVDGTANASVNRYDGAFVYSGNITPQQRRVVTGGLNVGTGTLTVEAPWSVPPVAGNEMEITRTLPVTSGQTNPEGTSYNACINRAAGKILVPDRVAVAITASETYPLAYAWLDRPERLLRVLEPPVTGTRAVDASWRNPRLVWSAGGTILELDTPFDLASGNLTLEVLRPADTLIGGVETTAGAGMTVDAQTVPVGLEELVPVALMEVLYALMGRNPGRPGQWDARYAEAKARAEALYHFDGAYYTPRAVAPAGVPA